MSLNIPPRSIHFEAVLEYPDGTSRRLVSCTYHTRFFAHYQSRIDAGELTYSSVTYVFPGTEKVDSVLLSVTAPWTAYPDGAPNQNNGVAMRPGGFLFISTSGTPAGLFYTPGVYYIVPAPPHEARVDCWAWTDVIGYFQVC